MVTGSRSSRLAKGVEEFNLGAAEKTYIFFVPKSDGFQPNDDGLQPNSKLQ